MKKYPHGLTLNAVCAAIEDYKRHEDSLPEEGILAAFNTLLGHSDIADELRIKQNHIRLRDTYIEELEQRAEAAEAEQQRSDEIAPVKYDQLQRDILKTICIEKLRENLIAGKQLLMADIHAVTMSIISAGFRQHTAEPAVSLAELVPTVCDGKEQEAFEEYARSKGLDLSQHPLHYLFLDGKTNQARSAWRECLVYVRAAILRNIEEKK